MRKGVIRRRGWLGISLKRIREKLKSRGVIVE
jgi:hypothetical protein